MGQLEVSLHLWAAHVSHCLLPLLWLGTPLLPLLPGLLLPLLSTAYLLLEEGFSLRPDGLQGFWESYELVSFVVFSLEGGSKLLSSYQKEP